MIRIPLSQGYEALIDDTDYDLISHIAWYADVRPDGNVYARGNVTLFDGKRTTVQLHRIIMDAPAGVQVDHIDRNGLNCIKSNMRLCTDSQNKCNATRLQSENGTGYRGVRETRSGRYEARVNVRGENVYRELFDDPVEAAKAYNTAASKHHGEFAILNEIKEI
jgi:hypothetical protein